ncbi:MAG: hypothetical protein IKQ31_01585 [Clostridia bacterium]|nr:hypothetical protein [Clostridia bacterium]
MINENEEINTIAPTKSEKKHSGCGTFFSGVLVGVLVIIVAVAGVIAYSIYHFNIRAIESAVGIEVPFIRGQYETMPLRDLFNELSTQTNEIKNMTLADLGEDKKWIDLPQKIFGTDLELSGAYEVEITLNGRTDKLKNFAVYNEIYKNFDDFVDQLVIAVYKTNSMDNLLKTLNVNIDQDLNYPIFKTEFFTVNSDKKTFRNLTISEALDVLPEYFGQDKFKMEFLIDGFNVDLSDFKFAQNPEFKNQTLSTVGNYMKTLPIEQLIDVKSNLESCNNTSDRLLFILRKLTYEDLSSSDIVGAITTKMADVGLSDFTLGQLIDVDENEDGFIKYIGEVKFIDLLGNNVEDSIKQAIIGENHDVTLGQILNLNGSDNLTNIFKDVLMNDLIGDGASPDAAIKNALTKPGNTLGYLLDIDENNNTGFIGLIKNVELEALFGDDPEGALKNELRKDGNTLGDLITIDSDDGIAGLIKKIKLDDLLEDGADVEQVFKDALSADGATLGDILGLTNGSNIVDKIAELKMADLFGDGANSVIENFVDNLEIADIFENYEDSKLLNLLGGATKISEIQEKIDTLKLDDLIDDEPAIFTLITNYNQITLSNLEDIEVVAPENLTLEIMHEAGLIEDDMYDYILLAGINKNTNFEKILDDYIWYYTNYGARPNS